jgi:hypothetical protein
MNALQIAIIVQSHEINQYVQLVVKDIIETQRVPAEDV